MRHLNKIVIVVSAFFFLFIGVSCSTTRKTSVDNQRRGLLMMEGDQIYKNKGFYKEKASYKRRKKNLRASKRKYGK